MSDLLDTFPGPYFDFLSLASGVCWDRPGRRAQIRDEFFHHPDAVRIQESIVSAFSGCLRHAHASFNYYGPTEYQGGNLSALISGLLAWRAAAVDASDAPALASLVSAHFLEDAEANGVRWTDDWSRVKRELIALVGLVLERAEAAHKEAGSLLVLGI
jgi:hypothetical protein